MADLRREPPPAQHFLNFMQFLRNFGKIVCWRPPWRVGAPSYGKSWMCPWVGPQVNKFEQVSSDDHQMSVVGEGVGYPGPMTRGNGYTGMWPIQSSPPMDRHPPVKHYLPQTLLTEFTNENLIEFSQTTISFKIKHC